jgi:hypothetical protein
MGERRLAAVSRVQGRVLGSPLRSGAQVPAGAG